MRHQVNANDTWTRRDAKAARRREATADEDARMHAQARVVELHTVLKLQLLQDDARALIVYTGSCT